MNVPQKTRSSILARLWKLDDASHAAWQVIGIAFSYIRDFHQEDSVSFEAFLNLVASVVTIASPQEYFLPCSLLYADAVTVENDNAVKRRSISDTVSFIDIVSMCFHRRLITNLPLCDIMVRNLESEDMDIPTLYIGKSFQN